MKTKDEIEPEENFPMGSCECCEGPVLSDTNYVVTLDDNYICESCVQHLDA